MTEKEAIIDIGTNSVRLLIADVNECEVICREHWLKSTRLGEGMRSREHKLQEAPVTRTLQAVKEFKNLSLHKGAGKIRVLATSAVREAVNREEFVERAYRDAGVQVEVLSWQDEAQYSYRGAINALRGDYREAGFVDIGGGSTELVWKKGEDLCWKSFSVGAVNLAEAFMHCDPPRDRDIHEMGKHLETSLVECSEMGYRKALVGTGGTVTTIASVKKELDEYRPQLIHETIISLKELKEIFNRLVEIPLTDRKAIRGMDSKRADIIIPGALIVIKLMEKISAGELVVSEGDLMAGALAGEQQRILI